MEEQWKDIDGYNGDYQISNYGRVRTFKQGANGRIMKPIVRANGYIKINLYREG